MNNSFYRAYEDRYRGSRELILSRLRVYGALIAPLAHASPPHLALDLGCGRGEWIELLGQSGFSARGIDLDEAMLAACLERNLQVTLADALSTLRACPDHSLAIVSAFHLVEHLPFDTVRELISEALRVLQPGGLLIMETPNSENLLVGASNFYSDPSHLRPLPPNLLAFAVEHGGFARHKVMRLQESPALSAATTASLFDVLAGVSPDYSVVAQKDGPAAVLASFDAPFAANYGIELHTLAERHDAGTRRLLDAGAQAHGELEAQLRQELHAVQHALDDIGAAARHAVGATDTLARQIGSTEETIAHLALRQDDAEQRVEAVRQEHAAALAEQARAAEEAIAQFMQHQCDMAHRDKMLGQTHAVLAGQSNAAEEAVAQLARQIGAAEGAIAQLAQREAATEQSAVRQEHDQQAIREAAVQLGERIALLESDAAVRQHMLGAQQEMLRANEVQLQHDARQLVLMTERLAQAEASATQMGQRVLDLMASRSWRVTAPLRLLGRWAVCFKVDVRKEGAGPAVRRAVHAGARLAIEAVLRRQRLSRIARRLFEHFPHLRARLYQALYQPVSGVQEGAGQAPPPNVLGPAPLPAPDLPPRTLRVYHKLKHAYERRSK